MVRKITGIENIYKKPNSKKLRRKNVVSENSPVPSDDEFELNIDNLIVSICTWNVGESYSQTVGKWIFSHQDSDIYAVGFQEVDMTLPTIVTNKSDYKLIWDEHFDFYIDKEKYTKIISHQLVGLYSIICIKNEHVPFISPVRWSQIGFGSYGLGNKGCIAYQFELYKKTFCFINTHFESGQNKIKERNENYDQIINDNLFDNPKFSPLKQDFVYFFGDFNYRLNLTREEVLNLIEKKKYSTLMEYDQLTKEKFKNGVFKNFEEEEIDFPPTYRLDRGTNTYDTSKKKRIPSYCDRIFIRAPEHEYECVLKPEVNLNENVSDHRPIFVSYKNQLI
eukprot:gene9143-1231_t